MTDLTFFEQVFRKITRRKSYSGNILETPLSRCLDTADLIFLGIAQMIGSGIFVLTGTLIKELAGPAASISYLFAGLSAVFAALCYAELATRLPKAGSCYTFTYFTIGEFAAFFIGWTLVSDLILSVAINAKGFSAAFDSIFGMAIKNTTISLLGKWDNNFSFLSETPDLFAILLIITSMAVTAIGAKSTLLFNISLTVIEIIILSILTFFCFFYGSFSYWSPQYGGFFPYGLEGVFAGASITVVAYVGFDGIANAAEETKSPSKSIPFAIMISLLITSILYVSATIGLSILIPASLIDINAPFIHGFKLIGQNWLSYAAIFATLLATGATKFVDMYVASRVIYSIASDNLIFPIFGKVWAVTQVPIYSLLFVGIISLVLAVFFKISSLAEMLSIGSLLSYAFAGICLILIRYKNLKLSSETTREYEYSSKHFGIESSNNNNNQNSTNPNNTTEEQIYPRFKPTWRK